MTDDHRSHRLEALALVAVGGFAGSNLRYLADLVVGGPPATLAVNALGSLALGFLLYEATYAGLVTRPTRTVLATGFLSSFTTYSTFALQSARAGPALLVGNVLANYSLGFLAVLVGRQVACRVSGERGSGAVSTGSGGDPGGDT